MTVPMSAAEGASAAPPLRLPFHPASATGTAWREVRTSRLERASQWHREQPRAAREQPPLVARALSPAAQVPNPAPEAFVRASATAAPGPWEQSLVAP